MYDGENVEIGLGGEAIKRPGSDVQNTSLNSDATLTAVGQQVFSASSEKTFAVAGNKFYEEPDGTPLDRTDGNTITAGDDNTWEFADADGALVGNNGVSGDVMIKWAASGNIAALDVDGRFTWAKHWAWWDGRVWAGNNSVAVSQTNYSSLADIETWAADDIFSTFTDVTGIAALGAEALALHGKNLIRILTPTQISDTPYSPYDRATKGSISGRAIAIVPSPNGGTMQLFPTRDGLYRFDGSESRKFSYRLDGARFWDNVNKDRLKQSFAIVYPNKNCVWFVLPYGSSQTNNNCIVVYDYLRDIFYPPYRNLTILERNCGALIDDVPQMGGYSDGFLYKHETNNNDDDGTTENKYDGWFDTSAVAPQGPDVKNRWLHTRISYEVKGQWDVQMTQSTESIGSNAQSFAQTGSYDAVGVDFMVGHSKIAGNNVTSTMDLRLLGYDPNSQVRMRNSEADQPFVIRSLVQIYNPLGRIRQPQT